MKVLKQITVIVVVHREHTANTDYQTWQGICLNHCKVILKARGEQGGLLRRLTKYMFEIMVVQQK